MQRYNCTPYQDKEDVSTDGDKFFIRSLTSADAASQAKNEADAQGYENVFVEDAGGFKIYDGPTGDDE